MTMLLSRSFSQSAKSYSPVMCLACSVWQVGASDLLRGPCQNQTRPDGSGMAAAMPRVLSASCNHATMHARHPTRRHALYTRTRPGRKRTPSRRPAQRQPRGRPAVTLPSRPAATRAGSPTPRSRAQRRVQLRPARPATAPRPAGPRPACLWLRRSLRRRGRPG